SPTRTNRWKSSPRRKNKTPAPCRRTLTKAGIRQMLAFGDRTAVGVTASSFRPCIWLVENAAHVLAGTGRQRPRARRLLSADRARPVADLQRRRHCESRARRVLRLRRLCSGRTDELSRLRPGHRNLPDRRRHARDSVRTLHPAAILHGGPDPEPAGHLWSRDDRRAIAAHHLGCRPVITNDATKSQRRGLHRRFSVFALPADAACSRRSRPAWNLVAAAEDAVWTRGAGGDRAARHGRRTRH